MEKRLSQLHQRSHVPLERQIRFWMREPVVTISATAPISEALIAMRDHDVRRLPVVSDTDELCGMITQGDIRGADVLQFAGLDLVAIADGLCKVRVSDVMSKNPIAVTGDTDLREAASLMIEHKCGGLPVIDEANMVVGIITESDLFEALVQQLDNNTC